MKARTTLLLLLAVLVLGSFILLFERRGDSTDQRIEQARKAIRLNVDHVRGFSLQRGALTVQAERKNDQWMMQAPIEARADNGVIERMLHALARMQKGEVITARDRAARGMTLIDYALDNPQIRMDLRMENGNMRLLVGRKSPLENSVYVMVEGSDHILAVDVALLDIIPASTDDLRDRALFPGAHRHIRRLGIRRTDGYLQLARDDRGKWSIQQPFVARANQKAVHELVDVLLRMRVQRFIGDQVTAPEAFGMADAAVQLSVWANGDEVGRTLTLGHPAPDAPDGIYAKWNDRDAPCIIPAAITNLAQVKVDALRDPHLLAMTPSEITDVRISRDGQRLSLHKSPEEGWVLTEPVHERADRGRIEGLLYAWTSAQVTFFIPAGMTNELQELTDKPWDITLLIDTTNRPERKLTSEATRADLRVGKIGADLRTVMVSLAPEGVTCMVDGAPMDYLSLDPLFYRSRRVLNLDETEIRRVTLKCGDREQTVARADADSPFVAADPAIEVDVNVVEAIIRIGSRLDASSFVIKDPRDLTIFGLDEPRVTLTFGLRGGAGISKAILIGNDSYGGEVYAMVRGQDVVFKLDKSIEKVLTRDVLDPQAPEEEKHIEPPSETISAH
ncbi:MAG: DUF4340 domain-containing protein [Spartobacteria bacterium]|nr:DUF4340 domain-containing protein [Spartobacteria bacterium]